MVLDERERSLLGRTGYGGPGASQGFNPASTMPNYSVMGGQNQQTYKPAHNARNPQSTSRSTYYQMSESRIGN